MGINASRKCTNPACGIYMDDASLLEIRTGVMSCNRCGTEQAPNRDRDDLIEELFDRVTYLETKLEQSQ